MGKLKDKITKSISANFYRVGYYIYDRAGILICVLLGVALGAILTWGML
jgi:hypothetical protein